MVRRTCSLIHKIASLDCRTGGGGFPAQVLGATEVKVEEEWVCLEDSKKGSHYCWLRKRLIAVDCRTDSMALNIMFNSS